MVRFSHDEIPSNSDPGSGYGFAKDVARQARNAACSLYDKYPGAATAGTIPGSPAHEWMRGFWNDMCRKAPGTRPDPPKKQHTGGQCACVDYRITYQLRNKDGSSSGLGTSVLNGKITGFGSRTTNGGIVRVFTCTHEKCTNGVPVTTVTDLNQSFVENDPKLEIVSVVRVDGQPDNCGDPPASYPPPLNGTPPSGELTKPYTPKDPKAPGVGFGIFVPFVFVDANANVNVDVGGVNLNFDLGGVTFNIDNKFGDGSPGSVGGKEPDLSGLEEAIDQAKNAAEAAKNAADQAKNAADQAKKVSEDRSNNDGDDPQNDPNKQDKTDRDEDDPKEEAGIERLLAVRVTLLEKPTNIREQDGGDAPNVYYAGWFQFSTKGTPHPRNYIHFEDNYFLAPVGADGFSYTVYQGIRAKHTIITAKETPPSA